MQRKVILSLGILFCLTAVAQAGPTIVVGNHFLIPNTAGQIIPISVTGIAPNTVNGIVFSVAISGGGPAYGGALGPVITAMNFDSGPTIWLPPSAPGHNLPSMWFDPGGQLAEGDFLIYSGFVTATSGLVATLTIDTTGFFGHWTLDLTGGVLDDVTGSTTFTGQNFVGSITNGSIIAEPEPSSMVLGLFAVVGFGAVVFRKRRAAVS
jgi:hypothetical protein